MSNAESFQEIWNEFVWLFWDPVGLLNAFLLTIAMMIGAFLAVDPRGHQLIRQAIGTIFQRHR